jgi:drug/metabolite transporter (DMT)-like permease
MGVLPSVTMSPKLEVILSIISYSLCSASLVLVNKLILHHLPFPSLVISFQLLAAIVIIYSLTFLGAIECDSLHWKYILPYLAYTVAFSLGVLCNMKSLQYSNVETVIVFRALAPCIVAILDALFLGREYPSPRSWAGLSIIVLGAVGYAMTDSQFENQGYSAYFWPTLYCAIISFEMAYGKKIIKSVDLKTMWGPVLYTNLLGFPPMLLFAKMGNEYERLWADMWVRDEGRFPPGSIILLALGCLIGTAIGYTSWWCRDKVSATSFTLIGVLNKCMTVLFNLLIWDNHASPLGILSLVVCLLGGLLYRQAPMKSSLPIRPAARHEIASRDDDVWDTEVHEKSVQDEERELLPKTFENKDN